jgi:integrase
MLMSEGSKLMAKLGRKAVQKYAKDWQSFSPIEVWNAYRQSRVERNGREISSGANHLRWYLRKLVAWAIERGLLTARAEEELKQIPKVKVPPRRIRVPEPELVDEFLQMIETEDEQGASFLRFLGSSGLRRGAALGLTWKQVDFASGSLEVRQKGGRVRVLPMSAEAIEVLESRRNLSRPWFFDQNAIDRLSRKMRKYAKGFDLDLVTYHAFRHYFASRALMSGLTVQEVATLLGHSDGGVLVLQTYGHICGARLRAAVGNLRLTTAS